MVNHHEHPNDWNESATSQELASLQTENSHLEAIVREQTNNILQLQKQKAELEETYKKNREAVQNRANSDIREYMHKHLVGLLQKMTQEHSSKMEMRSEALRISKFLLRSLRDLDDEGIENMEGLLRQMKMSLVGNSSKQLKHRKLQMRGVLQRLFSNSSRRESHFFENSEEEAPQQLVSRIFKQRSLRYFSLFLVSARILFLCHLNSKVSCDFG